jgi:hypothetical protein
MNTKEQLDKEIEEYNGLHGQIEQGEQQLAGMKVEKERRYGRVMMLQEILEGESEITTKETITGEVYESKAENTEK